MTDRIEKSIEIKAPVSRVWQALTDYKQFGKWFGAELDGPFLPGETVMGKITIPGYEHVKFAAYVKDVDPEHRFSFEWHPYAVDPSRDYSVEPRTLIAFRLEPTSNGTRINVTESGFDRIPADRRTEAFRMNNGGWEAQLRNIEAYVTRN